MSSQTLTFGPRRGAYADVAGTPLAVPPAPEREALEWLDALYRALCAILFNYVPTSGHPGGSVSSGRIVAGLLFGALDYDVSRPEREDADVISYAAGHKAMGLYALWALRDEIVRTGAPELLPDVRHRLRLEDLLGFRRNPVSPAPLALRTAAKALDGHPTPAVPFVRLATGASGVGLASSIGLALAARDYFGPDAPRIHVIEGEGGLTPGRVQEALAAAGTASLDNVVVHVDWNQASIDSDRVCRDGERPGDYVQWTPAELFRLHDWNVVEAPDGMDFTHILAAQRMAEGYRNGQPTAVVYRTVKGWRYGVEGRASHGAGHPMCTDGFYRAVNDAVRPVTLDLPACEEGHRRCDPPADGRTVMEQCFWEALSAVRRQIEEHRPERERLATALLAARRRLDALNRRPRAGAPDVEVVYATAGASVRETPAELRLLPGASTTLRAELGRALGHLNTASGGALMVGAADLLASTSASAAAAGFPAGYWNAGANPGSRILSLGGICEDGMAGILSGISGFGHHIGIGSSYGAFMAPLGHIAARLHGIAGQARKSAFGSPFQTMVLVCAHAGLKTGEDGPTHADPQALQLLQGNFPPGVAITLTPWEPQEIWPLLAAALARRPALLAPFVTRPPETVLDRRALGLAPPQDAASGVYLLRRPGRPGDGTIVLQESAVAYVFVREVLPLLDRDGLSPYVYYVASSELFDLLPEEEQQRIFPEARAQEAMGITGFTLPTMERWIHSSLGRRFTLHPYLKGHYLGSGQGDMVMEEAGLGGRAQYDAIRSYVEARRTSAAATAPALTGC